MQNKVLIIEDDHSIRELLQELLESEGYTVSTAVNGLEGLKHLENGLNPNLILFDLMMPVMDGYTFRKEQLKNEHWKEIPVVVMSAEANAKKKMKDYEVEVFLSKPIELDTILETVASFF